MIIGYDIEKIKIYINKHRKIKKIKIKIKKHQT